MTLDDYNKHIFRFHAEDPENLWMEESSLKDVLLSIQSEADTPQGIVPDLRIQEENDDFGRKVYNLYGWRHMWKLIDSFEKEDEATLTLLNRIYEYDFIYHGDFFTWCNSRDEAINAYVQPLNIPDEDAQIILEIIKDELAKCERMSAEAALRERNSTIETFEKESKLFRSTGIASKQLRKAISTILFSEYRGGYGERPDLLCFTKDIKQSARAIEDEIESIKEKNKKNLSKCTL